MVTPNLSADEALVLFELLYRFQEGDGGALTIQHKGEEVALWRLLGELERVLVEPFRPDYTALVEAARDRLVGDPEA